MNDGCFSYFFSFFRTSPEEFLNRLALLEEAQKKGGSPDGATASSVPEKAFSFPTKPKKDVKGGTIAMSKEKVRHQ